jgi:hypothetical protein
MTDTPDTSVPTPAPLTTEDQTLQRLDDQLSWYSQRSRSARLTFKRIKITEIIAAAIIPLLTGHTWPYSSYIIGGLGVLITILEGILHLNQYQENWTAYRATAESLKHEKFLYLAKAGPYTNAADPRAALAERVEAAISQENSQWIATLQKSAQTKSN